MENKITKNKAVGVLLFLIAIAGIIILICRIAFYQYEYHPQNAPVDYGRFNVLSYFTIQSNFVCCLYFLMVALGIFGNQKAQKIGFSPTVGALITLYVLVAGVTYNMGFVVKMSPPLTYDTPYHAFISCMQMFYHVLMPVVAVSLWCFPLKNEKLGIKCILSSGIYPLAYSVFSIIRGALFEPTYYPYPFYNPAWIWQTFMGDKPMNLAVAYLLIAVLLAFGIALFIGIEALLVLIHNKRVRQSIHKA